MPNTAVDIIFVLIILLSAILAFVRGATREMLGIGIWLIAVYLGFTQYKLVTPWLLEHVHGKMIQDNEMIRNFLGGLAIFAGVMLILVPISFYLRSFVKGESITAVDRSLGFLFGAARGYLLLAIFYLVISWQMPPEKQPEWLKEANTRPALAFGADLVKSLIPEEQRQMMEKKADEAKKTGEAIGTAVKEKGSQVDDVLGNLKGVEQK
jgi:membrane protein required for colicin V production